MSQKLAKSPELLRKEAEAKDLEAQLKKKQTTLKSLKTRLQNIKSDVEEIGRRVQSNMLNKMEEVDQLRMEIAALARQLKMAKGMNKMDKEQLQMMADEMADSSMFGDSYDEYREQKQQRESGNFDFDEFERARMRNMFAEFEVKPPEKEQKEIRKVFLKLSQKFHPDLAKNEKEAQEFHLLMQQINEANQHNDIQALLELESLYLHESLDFEAKATTVDSLQLGIDRLKRDLQFIEKQLDRTSEEIKQLRKSDLGKMLTSVNKAERKGNGLDDATAQVEEMLQMFTKIRDGLTDSIRLGRISPKLMDLLLGEDPEDEEDDFDFMDPFSMLTKLANGDESAFDFFNAAFDNSVEDPVFPIGSSVRVVPTVWSPFDKKTNMQGWEGRVEEAFYDHDGEEAYAVAFDSLTVAQMSTKLVDKAIKMDDDFQEAVFSADQLVACKPRDTEAEALAAYRVRFHGSVWKSLPDKSMAARLQAILLADTSMTDHENWTNYLAQHLSFPFEAKLRGSVRPNKNKVGIIEVIGIKSFDEQGHIMATKANGKKGMNHPLAFLQAADENSLEFQILQDYLVWVAHSY
ncbi:MAG: hypothetical protein K9J37_15245 [Saprospiraceae bacterium]|nr:hypothetical protein [Saprospiraceae bacterium]MCF8251266.1 hypothetical protein [Saprospiraceae bacterium]MCF8280843.1 hypothetical protein [Bacteroidales bacterium]MCF8311803.1 hypothetical protein [Saprospiraceae bacterium]MCF8441944.1 hypothetical protein [Saprospiraceae bacterium]